MADIKLTLVVACALVDTDKRVLIAQRPDGKALAGLWEFPGGKVEPGERPEQTLIRELHEEIGIDVSEPCLAPLTFASYAYDTFHLLMPLYICRRWEGMAIAREGQQLRLGPRQQAARLSDAARGHSADPAFDRFVDVEGRRSPDGALRSRVIASEATAVHDPGDRRIASSLRSLAMTAAISLALPPSPPPPDSLSPSPAAAASAGFHAAPSRTARSTSKVARMRPSGSAKRSP